MIDEFITNPVDLKPLIIKCTCWDVTVYEYFHEHCKIHGKTELKIAFKKDDFND